jgi:hypothetical protein
MDSTLEKDPEYRAGIDAIVEFIGEKTARTCQYYRQGYAIAGKVTEMGDYLSGAMFAVVPLGQGRPLSLSRTDIREFPDGKVSIEAQKQIAEYIARFPAPVAQTSQR